MTATIELGFPETRKGIMIIIEGAKAFDLERIIRGAAQIGAGFDPELRRVNDPGWWAALICSAALHHRFPAGVARMPRRGDPHARVLVERGRMVNLQPTWPTFAIDSSQMVDIRPESILEAGPSDDDLRRYADQLGIDAPTLDLRRSFELGVLEWDIDVHEDGRWKIRAAI